MIARLIEFALVQRVLVCILGLALFFGGLYAFHILDVVAYPDPSPPMVEVITQSAGGPEPVGNTHEFTPRGAAGAFALVGHRRDLSI